MIAGAGVLGGDAIPGDRAALEGLVSRLTAAADHVESIHGRVAGNGLGGSWTGSAANAFRASLHQLPGELEKIRASFVGAGDALRSFAATLAELQNRANWLASQITEAEHNARQADTRHANAQSQLHAAHRANALAGDPVSKTAAQHAINRASSAVAVAAAAQDEFNGQVSSLRSAASTNHAEWDQAAATCAGRLDAASNMGIRETLGSWFERNVVQGVGGSLLMGGERLFGKARNKAIDEVKKHGAVKVAEMFFTGLATDARGRPMSLARALLHGSLRQRTRHVSRYFEMLQARVVHRVYNAGWGGSGLQRFKPAWKQIAKPAKFVGDFLAPAVDAYGEARHHHYTAAVGSIVGGVLIKDNKPAQAIDMITGGSVSGYAKAAVELPSVLASGEKGLTDFTHRVESGHYGPLPKWENQYVSQPLGDLIYSHIYP